MYLPLQSWASQLSSHCSFSGLHTPSSTTFATPSSALRIALQSTLLTTQHQCDNVRPLLSALASPSELSQLSEMYAPSSPVQSSFNLQTRPSSPPMRPSSKRFSYSPDNAVASSSNTKLSTPISEKRRTWNGQAGDRTPHSPTLLRRRDHRRSDMNSLVISGRGSSSGLQTPPRSPSLAQVLEDDEEEDQNRSGPAEISLNEHEPSHDVFGTAALYLRR